jgi:hypothetical protein
MMPKFAPSRISLIFNSAYAAAQVGTVEDGNEVSCVVELVISRWVYVFTIFNNLLLDYRQLDNQTNFQGLQDSINMFVKSLEDILIRLTKFEYCKEEIWVKAVHSGKTAK